MNSAARRQYADGILSSVDAAIGPSGRRWLIPSREDFARWRDDAVTRFVLAAHTKMAADNKAEWERISWGNGVANQKHLDELRTRADAYEAISASTYDSYCDALGEQPRDD